MSEEILSGKKTYLVAVAIGLVSVAYALGWIDKETWLTLLGLLNGAGLAALRDGVKKSGPTD